MNKRIFLVGLVGGILVSAAAQYPLQRWLPSGFVEGWPAADSRTAVIWTAVAAVLLLLTGIVAARMSGTRNRFAAAGAGAAAGLIAALLVELFWGGAAAGVYGSRLMLAHGLHATKDEAEFIYLLVHGVSSILWWVHLSIWAAAGAGLLLGGLGGLAAGGGGKPARPDPAFWLTVSAIMVLTAATSLIVNIAVYQLLGPITQEAADKMNLTPPYPSASIFTWPVASSLVWLLLWQVIGWLSVRKAPAERRMNFLFMLLLTVFFSFVLLPVAYWLMSLSNMFIGPLLWWWPYDQLPTAAILLIAAAVLAWGATKARFRPRSSPVRETRLGQLWKRANGFFQNAGEARVAAWYFLFMAVLTISLVFFTYREGFLLPWLDVGLALGLLFAILGILAARKTVPAAQEPEPPAPKYFAAASLTGLFTNLMAGLFTLAPLSMVLIPIVLIVPLMLHNEAAALAAAGSQTLPVIVSVSYTIPPVVAVTLGIITLIFALLITAAGTVREKWFRREPSPEPSAPANPAEKEKP
jgi:hypothetical protein